jgi:pyruvate dehydrogenase E2 component (dihydrolipoamide acetyltransferase)
VSANKGDVNRVEPSRAQRAVARRASESRATVPHLELQREAGLHARLGGLELTALVVKACGVGLREVPQANAAYRDGRFELYSRVNVGVALPSEDAVVVPTVFDADQKPVAAISEELAGLRERAVAGQLEPPELGGATFTLWSSGAASASPLIVPPQAAAISFGALRAAAVVRGGEVMVGHAVTLTLACDHRILYGTVADAFLESVTRRLEDGSA